MNKSIYIVICCLFFSVLYSKPVADAGADITFSTWEGNVSLNGGGSYDPGGSSLTYSWEYISDESGISLIGTSTATPYFDPSGIKHPVDLEFRLTVNNGIEDSDPDIVVCSVNFSAPKVPELRARSNHEKIILKWDDVSLEVRDSLTGYYDFEGYKLYRSEDGGQTWGDKRVDNMNNEWWIPYATFDYTAYQDSSRCVTKAGICDYEDAFSGCASNSEKCVWGREISGPDRFVANDFEVIYNTGVNDSLKLTFIDEDVIDGVEYHYALTAYDMGFIGYQVKYESSASNVLCNPCGADSNITSIFDCCLNQLGGSINSSYSYDNPLYCTLTEPEAWDECGYNEDAEFVCEDCTAIEDTNEDGLIDSEDCWNDSYADGDWTDDDVSTAVVDETENFYDCGDNSDGIRVCSNCTATEDTNLDGEINSDDCWDSSYGDGVWNQNDGCSASSYAVMNELLEVNQLPGWDLLYAANEGWLDGSVIDYVDEEGKTVYYGYSNPNRYYSNEETIDLNLDGNLFNGYRSLESPIGSVSSKNYVTVIPGYFATNIENIDYDGESDTDVFVEEGKSTIGNGPQKFLIIDEYALTDNKYHIEIQADRYDSEGEIVATYGGLKTENPLLYIYEIKDNGMPDISTVFSSLSEEESLVLMDLPGARYTYCSIIDKVCFDDEGEALLSKDCSRDEDCDSDGYCDYLYQTEDECDFEGGGVWGSYADQVILPVYEIEEHPIMYQDDDFFTDNWTDDFSGINLRFDNALNEQPPDRNAKIKELESVPSNLIDQHNLRVKLRYQDNVFDKRPSYNYVLLFSDTAGVSHATETYPLSACIQELDDFPEGSGPMLNSDGDVEWGGHFADINGNSIWDHCDGDDCYGECSDELTCEEEPLKYTPLPFKVFNTDTGKCIFGKCEDGDWESAEECCSENSGAWDASNQNCSGYDGWTPSNDSDFSKGLCTYADSGLFDGDSFYCTQNNDCWREVPVIHKDFGIYDQTELGDSNCTGCLGNQVCRNGVCIDNPGYGDCFWEKNEQVFLADTVTVYGESGEEEEKIFQLKLNFDYFSDPDFWSSVPFDAEDSYVYADVVSIFNRQMLFEANEDIYKTCFDGDNHGEVCTSTDQCTNGECLSVSPLDWIDNDKTDNFIYNSNPWSAKYPWDGNDTLYIRPTKWYVDEDYWIADVAQIGIQSKVSREDLSKIQVVPNPYIVYSDFQNSFGDELIWFTNLPNQCRISIYTVSGEIVDVINYNDAYNGSVKWDLKSKNGDRIVPGLYFYIVEVLENKSSNGEYLYKRGKFAIVR